MILMNLKIFSDENEKWRCRNISFISTGTTSEMKILMNSEK